MQKRYKHYTHCDLHVGIFLHVKVFSYIAVARVHRLQTMSNSVLTEHTQLLDQYNTDWLYILKQASTLRTFGFLFLVCIKMRQGMFAFWFSPLKKWMPVGILCLQKMKPGLSPARLDLTYMVSNCSSNQITDLASLTDTNSASPVWFILLLWEVFLN